VLDLRTTVALRLLHHEDFVIGFDMEQNHIICEKISIKKGSEGGAVFCVDSVKDLGGY
jgi:hypothetical protein